MGVPSAALPDDSPYLGYALNIALLTANRALRVTGLYPLAVYNLGASLLLNFAPDQTGSTYFADIRSEKGLDLVGFVPGVVAASGDQGTSTSLLVPDFMKNLTMDDLQRLKDPYGRAYLAVAQDYGPTVWGIS